MTQAASVLSGPLYPGQPMFAASAPLGPMRMAIPRAVRQAARALRDLWTHGCNTTWSVTFPSLNEIGRWSESSAKDESLIPADRVQGQL